MRPAWAHIVKRRPEQTRTRSRWATPSAQVRESELESKREAWRLSFVSKCWQVFFWGQISPSPSSFLGAKARQRFEFSNPTPFRHALVNCSGSVHLLKIVWPP